MNFQLAKKQVSSAHKLIYFMLTSTEIGFRDVRIEHQFSDTETCDIYVPEANLIIEIDGPTHFFNRKSSTDLCIPVPTMKGRQLSKLGKNILRLNVTKGDSFFDYDGDQERKLVDMTVETQNMLALKLKELIKNNLK